MSEVRTSNEDHGDTDDSAPGDHGTVRERAQSYLLGLGLAVALTVASFVLPSLHIIYVPGLAWALLALAVAQIGVHLAIFLHLTTSPDNTNNILALAFGVFIVVLVIGGTSWIMSHLNANMMLPMGGYGGSGMGGMRM